MQWYVCAVSDEPSKETVCARKQEINEIVTIVMVVIRDQVSVSLVFWQKLVTLECHFNSE